MKDYDTIEQSKVDEFITQLKTRSQSRQATLVERLRGHIEHETNPFGNQNVSFATLREIVRVLTH